MSKLKQAIFSNNRLPHPLRKLLKQVHNRFRPTEDSHVQEYQEAQYLLISPTNCGRTWLRIMLGNYLKLAYEVSDHMAVDHLYLYSQKNPNIPSIKSLHSRYHQFHDTYQDKKIILLVRDPRDALISKYYQLKRRKRRECPISDYVTNNEYLTNYYIRMYNEFYENQADMKGFLLVRYEDLTANITNELKKIIDFCGLITNPDYIEQAVEAASFENMKKMEKSKSSLVKSRVMNRLNKHNLKRRNPKVRKGKTGGYKDELDSTVIAYLDQVINEQLNLDFGYSTNA